MYFTKQWFVNLAIAYAAMYLFTFIVTGSFSVSAMGFGPVAAFFYGAGWGFVVFLYNPAKRWFGILKPGERAKLER